MRLIDVKTLELRPFIGDPEPYAILSHTWGEDEVTFQDFADLQKRSTQRGFEKIRLTCEQALKDGIPYVWVDTCCINKESSSELTEAINSMFKWYQKAKICYAYLEDIGSNAVSTPDPASLANDLSKCRWFTRGWTLQELVASHPLEFYGAGWTQLGYKADLTGELGKITGIDERVLRGDLRIDQVSVARRMRWAAKRQTTREEDMAYCLMGIFDVNMPMLYGEGSKAFIRLQEEIMKETDDQSLFAWTASVESAAKYPYRGLLAACPAEFAESDGAIPFPNITANHLPLSVTNRGVPLASVFEVLEDQPIRTIRVGLNCRWSNDFFSMISVELVCRGGDQYLRSRPDQLFTGQPDGSSRGTLYVSKATHASKLDVIPFLERQHAFYIKESQYQLKVVEVFPKDVAYSPQDRLIQLGPWAKDKAVVKLSSPDPKECMFVIFWVTVDASGQVYTPSVVAIAGPPTDAEKIWTSYKKISTPSTRRLPTAFQGGLLEVVVEPRRIQGFDMFCLEFRAWGGSKSG